MQALLRTTRIETAAPAQRAGLEAARSCQHQTKGRALPCSWPVAAPLEQYQDRPASRAGFLSYVTPLRSTCRGVGPGLFHSHRFAALHRLSRSGSVFPPCGQTRVHSLRVVGANRSHAHTVAHQQFSQCLADVHHFQDRLSKPRSSAGFKTSCKELQGRGISIQELGKIRARERSHD